MRKAIAVLILCTVPGYCAQTATLQWLVRQDGADTNGGGFDVGVSSPGTNESTGAVGTSVTITVGVTTTQAVSVPAFTSTTHGPGNVLVLHCRDCMAKAKQVAEGGGRAVAFFAIGPEEDI